MGINVVKSRETVEQAVTYEFPMRRVWVYHGPRNSDDFQLRIENDGSVYMSSVLTEDGGRLLSATVTADQFGKAFRQLIKQFPHQGG